jgi:outer membrane protein OmpA-like peptidoglycan-associated protein
MTPRQTIRLSGVISCARHEGLGQRLAVNSFTVIRLKYSKRRQLKSTIFRPVFALQPRPASTFRPNLLAGFSLLWRYNSSCATETSHPPPTLGIPSRSKPLGRFTRKEDDMKNRTCITLLLSMGLALSAFAQQSTSNSTTRPAASANQSAPSPQPLTASADDPLQPPPHQDFWDGDEPSLTWLVLHPFASKQYVRRHVQPIQDRVNELDELTADGSRRIKDVDARAQQGIQMVSAKTSLADEHAQDAASKAQMAHQTLATLGTRVATDETVIGNIDQYKSGAQTEIRFRPGQTVLSKQAKNALDDLAAQVKGQHGYIIEVQGFSSGRGQAAIANSKKMADSVERYLVLNHEVPAYRIYVVGMGNAPQQKHAVGTRIEVSLLKNEFEQAAK